MLRSLLPLFLVLGSVVLTQPTAVAQSAREHTYYTCRSQVVPFPDRRNVGREEAIRLVQQMDGNLFIYHCGPQSSVSNTMAVTGVVTYRQRIALPPGSVVEVKLLDVSRADAPSTTIAEQTITTTGQQVPIPFTLPYAEEAIDPRFRYAVQVRILIDGQLRWISTSQYPVITQDYPTQDVEVVVNPV